MRAAVLWEWDQPLAIEEAELTALGQRDVRVALGASGVCHTDLSFQRGAMPEGAQLTTVLGHEGAGVVLEVGGAVTDLEEGDHVILSWVNPCGRCPACVHGRSFDCPTAFGSGPPRPRFTIGGRDALPFVGVASFAEETIVPASAAIKIAKDVPMDVAALIGCGVMTGVGAAVNDARVEPGSSVVVIGCGGVGMSVIQGARLAGAAEILAVDRQESKLGIAKRFGASHAVLPEDLPGAVEEITGGMGFDYAFEALGRPETVRMTLDAVRRHGLAVIIGAGPAAMMSQIDPSEVLHKRVMQSVYGGAEVRTDFHKIIRLWKAGRLDLEGLISQRVGLEDVNDALQALASGEVVRSVIELSSFVHRT